MMMKLKERLFTTVNRLWVAVAAMAVAMTAYSTDCVWLADQGGDWSDAASWKDGNVPSTYDDTADFSVLTGDKIVRRDYYCK